MLGKDNNVSREYNNYHNNKRINDADKYLMLFKLIEKYIDSYGNNIETSETN